ncbi:FHA domain-containing protein FhaB/FipA [Leucobacter tenebrionis]|uniref:FHA domain-containing protein FhaB/FipA n=1 Tax=Leucobacter tenebrionis TaxID=2873270 RepID=UPI001CA785F3|nr:FHA domain-containing protein [Leucobacter tenebrionis]QZY50869.1 FHA domain-containing protein [Leucobacter tenebrionis]
MSELTLLILRIGFLLLLWFFIFAIVYALRSDLFGAPVRRLRNDGDGNPVPQPALQVTAPAAPAAPAPAAPAAPAAPPVPGPIPSAGGTGPARLLVITSGVAAGTSIPLEDDILTIGRSSDSTLVIVDEYTSTYHARLARNGDEWILTDLDSTNGTRLDGARITQPVSVPLFTPVTIGTTTFELRP